MFQKKKKGTGSALDEHLVPTPLPGYGLGLDSFSPTAYSHNDREVIDDVTTEGKSYISGIVGTFDHLSEGSEADAFVEGWMEKPRAVHTAEIARNESQLSRIRATIQMRKEELTRKIAQLTEKEKLLTEEIVPLRGLRSQFTWYIGNHSISVGLLMALVAAVIDGVVNYSFLSGLLFSNNLVLLVAALSFMNDGCVYLLGTYFSKRKRTFTAKPVFITVCAGLLGMFLISVAASVMIRYGSMDITFGSINLYGNSVSKDAYSLAEYGCTLASAFLTTATGLASFALSVDDNADLVALRTRDEKELARVQAMLVPLRGELCVLNNAADPAVRDHAMRKAAEQQLAAIELALKMYARKTAAEQMKDATFTEKMADSMGAVLTENCETDVPSRPASLELAS